MKNGSIDGRHLRGGVQGVQARGQGPREAQAAHQGGKAHPHLQELALQVR